MDITLLTNAEYRDLPEPRPHRFPDKPPSDSCYAQGCRCQPCRDLHAAATRNRQQLQRAGLWIDGRRAIRHNGFLDELVELAERNPELYGLFRKHGHVPPVLQLKAEPVTHPQPASRPEPSHGGPQLALEPPEDPAEAPANPPPETAATDDSGATNQDRAVALAAAATRVLQAIALFADPITGIVYDRVYRSEMAAKMAGFSVDHYNVLLELLVRQGQIERKPDGQMVLRGIAARAADVLGSAVA